MNKKITLSLVRIIINTETIGQEALRSSKSSWPKVKKLKQRHKYCLLHLTADNVVTKLESCSEY